MPEIKPYGSWPSRWSTQKVAEGGRTFVQTALDQETGTFYWVEEVSQEGGRHNIWRYLLSTGVSHRLSKPPFSARTRAREYGRGALVTGHGVLAASNWEDQRLWRFPDWVNDAPVALTPDSTGDIPTLTGPKRAPTLRYADGVVDKRNNRIVSVCEDVSRGFERPAYSIVGIPFDPPSDGNIPAPQKLWQSTAGEFVCSLALSPDGNKLAFIAWDATQEMPWFSSRLMLAAFDNDGGVFDFRRIAGNPGESIVQPIWSPDGELYYISDRSGWWNPYRYRETGDWPVYARQGDFARPQWWFGMSQWAVAERGRIICSFTSHGQWRLGTLFPQSRQLEKPPVPYSEISGVRANAQHIFCIGSSTTRPSAVVKMDAAMQETTVVRQSTDEVIDPAFVSTPEEITFDMGGGLALHAWYYPPTNPECTAPVGEAPPLMMEVHGGPTWSDGTGYSAGAQFWTSRGFGYATVNFPGSDRYGCRYRHALNGRGGVLDLKACEAVALHLADQSKVDRSRMVISGWSWGGYLALAAATVGQRIFAGAICGAALADLVHTSEHTAGFESGYLDIIMGDDRALWKQRSPLECIDEKVTPLLLIHGGGDLSVPIDPVKEVLRRAAAAGVPVACYFYGEGDGEHAPKTSNALLDIVEAKLSFVSQVLGLTLFDEIAHPIEILNAENIRRK